MVAAGGGGSRRVAGDTSDRLYHRTASETVSPNFLESEITCPKYPLYITMISVSYVFQNKDILENVLLKF